MVSNSLGICIALWLLWLKFEVSSPPSGWDYTTVCKKTDVEVFLPQHPTGASPNPASEEVSSFVLLE